MQIVPIDAKTLMSTFLDFYLVTEEDVNYLYSEYTSAFTVDLQYLEAYADARIKADKVRDANCEEAVIQSVMGSLMTTSRHEEAFFWLILSGSMYDENPLSMTQINVFANLVSKSPAAVRERRMGVWLHYLNKILPGTQSLILTYLPGKKVGLVIEERAYSKMESIEPLWERFMKALQGNVVIATS